MTNVQTGKTHRARLAQLSSSAPALMHERDFSTNSLRRVR